MKVFGRTDGFTLIELLVAINIAFIAITFIISFYLFSAKFVKDTSSRLDWKENKDAVLFFIEQVLNKSQAFNIKNGDTLEQGKSESNSEIIITTQEGKIIRINRKKISLDKEFSLTGFDDSRIDIELKNGFFIKMINIKNSGHGINKPTDILSAQIKRIQLEIIKDQNIYTLEYNTPAISEFQFQNIRQ